MSRCDYDSIFQRVSCVALVAVAITFTVILTNVFVDIDGLLAKKVKAKTNEMPEPVLEAEHIRMKSKSSPNMIRAENYKVERNYEEEAEDIYRSKRSLESPNFLFHMKNPKMKSILTDRLATLLEELDEEESMPDIKKKAEKAEEKTEERQISHRSKSKNQIKEKQDVENKLEAIMDAMKPARMRKDENNKLDPKSEDDMLHLAMHNILLQGIIGHMDLNEVFKKVHGLVKSFKEPDENESRRLNQDRFHTDMTKHIIRAAQHKPSVEENKFFEELTKCDKLQNEVTEAKTTAPEVKDDVKTTQKGPKLLIKTIIDITSNKDKTHKDFMNSKESIKGIIKLIYNGKSVKFTRMEDEEEPPAKKLEKLVTTADVTPSDVTEKPVDNDMNEVDILPKPSHIQTKNSYFNQMIDSYLKKFPKNLGDLLDAPDSNKFETKRLKRQIKIRYENDEATTSNPKAEINEDDDELYVEIETHFDSKGMKGMKKKKLIRNIIDKIQKAIHSDLGVLNGENKNKHKNLQIKKRTQSPLDKHTAMFMNKIMIPFEPTVKRHSEPISKSIPLDKIASKSGETWKKSYIGPGFLTASKSLNSAEMGTVDVDYSKIMAVNGIPQRLQKPLNTDTSNELLNAKTYFDLGNLKFFIKNIDGTGLSIGFNQYTDEAPDPDTIKLFTGIENLIQNIDKNNEEGADDSPKHVDKNVSEENEHEVTKREINNEKHDRVRITRSLDETHENDYHSNKYKIIFDNNFLPYDTYQEIYEDNKKKVAVIMNRETDLTNFDPENIEKTKKNIETKALPELMDENIFYKKLKPSEILSLASILDRKKRSIIVKKIKKIKNRQIKINRFLNTNSHGRPKIILNKKRNKRQIDKIRIIASDSMNKHRQSEENIFIVDDDNLLADRAIISEIDRTDAIRNVDENEMKLPEEHYDMLPYVYEEPSYTTNVFDGRSRHNQLMSKYPHIFLEEITRSREDMEPILVSKIEVKPKTYVENSNIEMTRDNNSTEFYDKSAPKIEELVKAIDPKQNYKLTVKIFPKNNSMDTGFKEIHTSINKSFNRDGLLYTSLVNVSEISKVVKLNSTPVDLGTPMPVSQDPTESAFVKHIQEQQNKMDILLKRHKKRLDAQLDHLKRERLHLDNLSLKAKETPKPYENVKLPETTESPKLDLHNLNKDDVTNLLASALFNLQSQNKVTTQLEQKFSTETTTTTTKAPTTTTTVDPMKWKLLNKIQTNENITNEILHQINKNTEMLQIFLMKLTEKLTEEREAPKAVENKENTNDKNVDLRRNFDYNALPKFWKPFPPIPDTEGPFRQQTIDQKTNETHFSIPFVYAYQQPFPMPDYKQVPVASVVYHGHIHSKTFGKHQKNKENKPSKADKPSIDKAGDETRTKYFIDDLESVITTSKEKSDGLVKKNVTVTV